MDIIISIIYIILFIVMMVFVFSIGMLKQYMPKKEILLVLGVAFLIGCIGGAFFLEPVYQDLPEVLSLVEKNMPNNEETLYLDLSSSVDINELKNTFESTEGFKSYKETSITIPMWTFDESEKEYFDFVVGNIDSGYKSYNVTNSTIEIELKDNYSAISALKSFSDWYKLVYGGSISYAQIHSQLVVDSSKLEAFEDILIQRGIVASNMEGPVQESINNTNSSMVSDLEFTLACGGVGVVVAILGIYVESVVPAYRRFKKFIGEKRKR